MNNQTVLVYVDSDLEALVPGFLANRQRDIEKMRDALASDDYVAIQHIGHAMKGTGGTYGFDGITDLGAEIESAAKAGEAEAIRRGVENLLEYLRHLEIVYE